MPYGPPRNIRVRVAFDALGLPDRETPATGQGPSVGMQVCARNRQRLDIATQGSAQLFDGTLRAVAPRQRSPLVSGRPSSAVAPRQRSPLERANLHASPLQVYAGRSRYY
jgi:hypothetical protein